MAQIGILQELEIIKSAPFGVFLEAGELGEVLLPKRELPTSFEIGDTLTVFLYHDFKGRVIASRKKPKIQVNQCAYLTVADLNNTGAFMDWGMDKDLLVPFNQQRVPMHEGQQYVVYAFVDEDTGRVVASSYLHKYLSEENQHHQIGDEVTALICDRSDLGYKAVINNQSLGLIFHNDVVGQLKIGRRVTAYIKQIRDDGRINLELTRTGHQYIDKLSEQIIEHLKNNDGVSHLTDKSSPLEINTAFAVSKKVYKRAIGGLFKQGIITINNDEIRLKQTP